MDGYKPFSVNNDYFTGAGPSPPYDSGDPPTLEDFDVFNDVVVPVAAAASTTAM
jgi:hypothetical protein